MGAAHADLLSRALSGGTLRDISSQIFVARGLSASSEATCLKVHHWNIQIVIGKAGG